jgi:AAA domain
VAMIARQHNSALVVIDNLSAFVPGTLNDDFAIKQFYDRTDALARDGAAVLIVAHTSDKTSEHGPSRIPMGSSLIRFGPRWWCYAHRARGRLLLDFDGNDGRPWELAVTAPDGSPHFDVLGEVTADELAERSERRRRERGKAKLDRNAEIVTWLTADPARTQRDAADHFRLSVATVNRAVRAMR